MCVVSVHVTRARDLIDEINTKNVYLTQKTTTAAAKAPSDWYGHLWNAKVHVKILDQCDALLRHYNHIHIEFIRCLINIDVLSSDEKNNFLMAKVRKNASDLWTAL